MATLTDDERKTMILARIADVDNNGNPTSDGTGVAATNIELFWSARAGLGSGLQQLYTELDCVDAILARLALGADISTGRQGLKVYKSQRALAMLKIREALVKRINQTAAATRLANGGDLLVPLDTTTPVEPEDVASFISEIR